jgi:hypothetical protein
VLAKTIPPTANSRNCFRKAVAETGRLIKDICRKVLSDVKVACCLAQTLSY